MRWVAPTEKDDANHLLEKRLWDTVSREITSFVRPKILRIDTCVFSAAGSKIPTI